MRKPKKPRDPNKWKLNSQYFHEYNPYTLFTTQGKANVNRAKTRLVVDSKKREARVQTFYTFLQNPRKAKVLEWTGVRTPQGPHTFPHYAIHRAIVNAKASGTLHEFADLIPEPAKYNKRVDAEIPVGHKKRDRAQMAMDKYAHRHKRYETLVKMAENAAANGETLEEKHQIRYAHVINKLIQMHPHGSYNYKGKGAGKDNIQGKGESALSKPLSSKIDLPKAAGLTNRHKAVKRNNTLLATVGLLGVK